MTMTMDQFKDEVVRCLPGVELETVHAGPHAIETTLNWKEATVVTYRRDEKTWLVRFGLGVASATGKSLAQALTTLHDILSADVSYSRGRLDRTRARLSVLVQHLPPQRKQEV